MPQLDVVRRAVRCVLVYHGPRRAGKTETLQAIRHAIPPERRGDVVSRPSGVHPSLFVEHLRIRPCLLGELRLELDLVALPDHEALPLVGELLSVTDGIVFVGDSQAGRVDENRAALRALDEALRAAGVDLPALPFVFQWNKRDLPSALPADVLARAVGGAPEQARAGLAGSTEGRSRDAMSPREAGERLRRTHLTDVARGRSCFSTSAVTGEGVLLPLRDVALAVTRKLTTRRSDVPPSMGAVPAFGLTKSARGHARGAA